MYKSKILLTILAIISVVFAQVDITDDFNGTITAQYDDSPASEGIEKVIDNSTQTKYLTFHDEAWIQFDVNYEIVIKNYSISSANDYHERDPKNWTLFGSNDGENWEAMDVRSNVDFPDYYQKKSFAIDNEIAYSKYRLYMKNNSNNILQLSEWELWSDKFDHDLKATNVIQPARQQVTAVAPEVEIYNTGKYTETNFDVVCQISENGNVIYNETVAVASIDTGKSAVVTFPTWTPVAETRYDLKTWTNLSIDNATFNDSTMKKINYPPKKTYVVPYTHLDTQWGWSLKTTINEYLPNTMKGNFELLEKYPDFRYNFEGAYRYMLMKEHYPADYAKVKEYVKQGRWYPSGAMVEGCDVNLPTPEALMRQVLYGNNFFQEEFGVMSKDILLPDCFGFPYTLPTIAKHCGLIGFSTQKFVSTWSAFIEAPFSIGLWEGVDGSKIIAALKPSSYGSGWEDHADDIEELGEKTGNYVAMDYMGTGDIGGPVPEGKVEAFVERLAKNDEEEIQLVCATSDQLFKDLEVEGKESLETYNGELLLNQHGTGCYSSMSELKRYNRKNEQKALSAEIASATAALISGYAYPKEDIRNNWIKFLAHSFHDDLTGTSISEAYNNYSIPDYKATLNYFTGLEKEAINSVAKRMKTKGNIENSVPVVVYNPNYFENEQLVYAEVQFSNTFPTNIKVYDAIGSEVPAQAREIKLGKAYISFVAKVSSCGFAVYHVQASDAKCSVSTGLQITENSLENAKYRVTIDDNGDLSSVFDKVLGKELLKSPARWQILNDRSNNWPAWEVLREDLAAAPRAYVDELASVAIVDSGAASVTLRVIQNKNNSTVTHYYTLSAAADDYLKVDNEVNWQENHSNGSLVKVAFPLTASNSKTTYDLGLGVIKRNVNSSNLWEVPGHQWADISQNDFGVAILNDCKYGWDKPNNNTIRLTLLHSTTGSSGWYYNQNDNDKGEHQFAYGIYSHAGEWNDGDVVQKAQSFNSPLIAFQVDKNNGMYDEFSFLESDSMIAVMAVKEAEYSDDFIVRVREIEGKDWSVAKLTFGSEVLNVQEVNGMEQVVGSVSYTDNEITFPINSFEPKSFKVSLKKTTGIDKPVKTSEFFKIDSVYPNPSNSSTKIKFSIPEQTAASIKIYNEIGQVVKTMANKQLYTAGKYETTWNQQNDSGEIVSSGNYFVKIYAQGKMISQKLTVIK